MSTWTVDDLDAALRGALDRLNDLTPVLKAIGQLLVNTSQAAFDDEQFGEYRWEERYPNQSPPHINIAGAISDLNDGGTIKRRRFEPRPALSDTGQLRQSIAWRIVSRDQVEYGSTVPYAADMQLGLKSQLPITGQAKSGIYRFLKTAEGKAYRDKLGWILNRYLNVDTLETETVARPFVGVTDRDQRIIRAMVEAHVKGEL